MKTTNEQFQVNIHYSVDGSVSTSITRYNENGYVGELVDTQYTDGADSTDWCVFHGSRKQCELEEKKIMKQEKIKV